MAINKRIMRARERLESKRIGTLQLIYSVFLILLTVICQTTVFPYFSVNGICFDATVSVAVFLAMYTNEYYGSVYGLILGTFADIMHPSPFPVMPIVYLFICALCGMSFKSMKKGFFIRKLALGLGAVAVRSALLALIRAFGHPDPLEYIIGYELWHFVYTAAVMPIFMLLASPAGRASQGRNAI